jgi:hypothetical protein
LEKPCEVVIVTGHVEPDAAWGRIIQPSDLQLIAFSAKSTMTSRNSSQAYSKPLPGIAQTPGFGRHPE